MSTTIPSDESVSPSESHLDEASIMSSLSRLQEMHIALRNLRDTIPRVMGAVLVEPLAPEQLHSYFAQAATGAAADIKSFAHIMEDGRSKDAIEKAKDSKAKNGENISNWLVTEHEDWLDIKQSGASEDADMDGEPSDTRDPTADPTVGDLPAIVEKFKESHHGVEASLGEATKTVKIYLPPPAHIHFEVQPSPEGEDDYKVHTKEKTKLHNAILESVSARPKPKKLETLLEKLASYVDVKSRPCVKCSRLLDRNAQFPVGRSRKRIKQADGQCVYHWEAFHQACS